MSTRELTFKELQEENVVSIELFRPQDEDLWERFVLASNNGTIFNTRRFLSYHPIDRFRDCSLIFKKGRRWLAVMPAAVVENDREKILVSHPGATMAGPIFKSTTSIKDTFFAVESLLAFAKAHGLSGIKLTLPPVIYHARPGNYFDFALLDYGFTYEKREVSSVIPLDFAGKDTLLTFSSESRRAVRKAMKSGVLVEESDDFAGFYAILHRNLELRHNVRPTHSLNELLQLKRLFPEEIKLFAAMAEGEMIAGVVIFECNDRVALAFYISHREDKQKYRGVNLLFYEMTRWAIRRHFKFLDFGIFTVNMKPNWGLARFKESFGALGVFRETLVQKFRE